MTKKSKRLKSFTPINHVPEEEKLEQHIAKLPKNANITDVLQELTRWKNSAVKKFKTQKNTSSSGTLNINCR
ncbi:MAG: hypothetical protein FWH37_07625 [Candidatus Bathyarchaeota archaeon]|nr:hypothetical protein [Candidatus Termiticorpusculum sp.]